MRSAFWVPLLCSLATLSTSCSDPESAATAGATASASSSGSDAASGSGASGGAGGAHESGGSGGAGTAGGADVDAYAWPTPAGWFAEDWTFPLPWAPDLAYVGVEEARSADGFFDSTDPEYWSYAFAWWLEEPHAFDETALEDAFTRYYRGLCGGSFDPAHFKTTLMEGGPMDGQPGTTYVGAIETYDPFDTQGEITLGVRAHVFTCGEHRVVLLGASPKAFGDAIWTDISGVLASFQCL